MRECESAGEGKVELDAESGLSVRDLGSLAGITDCAVQFLSDVLEASVV